ncbi:MAG: hypothetical protein D6692_00480 [Planctomycetota bacterium]|nr:MAG: hypothetical protein D6692_00480 [Planctomycetota bacterium]
MPRATPIAFIAAAAACAPLSHAEPVAVASIVSPFDGATMEIEWRTSQPNATGLILWAQTNTPNITTATVFDLSAAQPGDRWTAPTLYNSGQSVLLSYTDAPGSTSRYTLDELAAGGYIQIRADAQGLFAVRSEMLQGTVSDSAFFDNALIMIRFAQLPAPGSVACGCFALAWAARRHR